MKSEDDMGNQRHSIPAEPFHHRIIILRGCIKMINFPNGLITSDDVDHGPIDVQFCKTGRSLFIGKSRMDPDDQTQFPADPDQVRKVGKDRDFSFTVTASGNQDSPRALLGQLRAEFKKAFGTS